MRPVEIVCEHCSMHYTVGPFSAIIERAFNYLRCPSTYCRVFRRG